MTEDRASIYSLRDATAKNPRVPTYLDNFGQEILFRAWQNLLRVCRWPFCDHFGTRIMSLDLLLVKLQALEWRGTQHILAYFKGRYSPKFITFWTITLLIIGIWSWFWYQNDRLNALYNNGWCLETIRSGFLVNIVKNVWKNNPKCWTQPSFELS